jgi:hypothetical protein
MAACTFLKQIHNPTPRSKGREECLKTGAWVHLRFCLSCGHVGPPIVLVRSIEPGEDLDVVLH